MLHLIIETSIFCFFFQQNQEKLIIIKISNVLHSILSKKQKKNFKLHFIDENENRKYVIDDVEVFEHKSIKNSTIE